MSDENNLKDEVNILNYWKIIRVRKRLLLFVFLSVTVGAAIVNLLLPKIYRGEYFIKLKIYDYADVYKTIKIGSADTRMNIFRKTNSLIEDINLTVFSDPIDCNLHVVIDAKDTSYIPEIFDEFIYYINNTEYQKKYMAQQSALLTNEIKELSLAIDYLNNLLNHSAAISNSDSIHVTEIAEKKISFAKQKLSNELALQNLSGGEVIFREIYSTPVKPLIKSNIILAGVIGLLAGIFIIFLADIKNKIRVPEN